MGVKYTNNAKTTISSGINNSVTTIPVASSSGFPSLSGSDYFYATLDDATNLEVVKVTAVSGTNWTVVRAQDDTTARAWSSGDDIELRLNAALLTDVVNDAMSDAFTRQAFTGDGSTTAFTLSKAPATENDLIVFIEGVFQTQSAYSVSGTTLTFSAAPANSREIIVYNITAAVNGDSLSQNNFTGDGSDTTFTLGTDPLHENNTMVFLDGVYQHKSTYSVSGTTLTFSTAPASGVAIECITHTQTEVNTPASNSVVTASIVDDNVTQAKIADDAVGADQLAASAVVTASIVDDNVTQAKIADDAVGADQLASSAVVTASIVDDAVTTAKIADDQVTLAKMAGLARGKIIYGDSSGNPAALTVGSAGTVLTSDGTDISWAEEVATNYLPLAGGTMTGDLILNDNVKLEIGSASGGDLQIYHDGSDSYITDTGTGNLLIQYSDLYFSKDAGSTHSVVFRSTGRVGFGTTGPARDMVLVTEGATNGFRIESNDETLMFLGAGASSGTGVDDNWVGQYSQGNLKNVFNANGDSYFNGGNVGIGVTDPASISGAAGKILEIAGSNPEIVWTDTAGTENSMSMYYLNNVMYVHNTESNDTSWYFKANGNVVMKGLNTTGSTTNRYPLYWVHTGTVGSLEPYTGSVRAMKTDIADMGSVDWIYSLTPRSFKFRDYTTDSEGNRTYLETTNDLPNTEYGLIAEEVDSVSGSDYILDKDSDDNVKGVLYHNLVPILLKSIQELEARIKTLEDA